MQFIIPKNYKFKPKIFGLIEYQSAILVALWAGFLYIFVSLFFANIAVKFYIFIALLLPVLLFCIIGFNNENIISVIKYMLKYYFNQKIYVYKKF